MGARKPRPADERGKWRRWLIGGYVVIIAVIAILWGYSLSMPISRAEEQQEYTNLEYIAHAGTVLLGNTNLDADSVVTQLSIDRNLRVTIIAADGTVLADSVSDAHTMENHADRPEVAAALSGYVGRDRRFSATEQVDYLYVAVPATYDNEPIALRVSLPLSQVENMAATFRNTGLILLVVSVIITLIIASEMFRRTSAPMGRLERVRTDFVANASHELKTPVAGIRLLSESISTAYADGNTELIPLFTERLDKETQRLQNLVTDLLDLSRLEDTTLKPRGVETCDLLSAVSTSYEAHLWQAHEKGLEFVLDSPDDETGWRVPMIPADAMLLVDNLVENAITYTETGSVSIRLEGDAGTVKLTVSDTGIGIPEADQERVFERFFRSDKARSREMGGTGLGLSLVKHVVERAGGHINLTSGLKEGSVFAVTLPRARA